jgi:hypothetical protein
MRILVTGARLPAALELARALSSRGHEIFTADTVKFGFAVRSSSICDYIRVPSPVHDYKGFRTAILKTLRELEIDLVIPVSEEIFFLAKFASEMPCPLFASPLETLRDLHSKLKFQKYTKLTPPTRLVRTRAELDTAVREFGDSVVIKQEFSRGAIGTHIRPTSFEKLRFPTLVQKFIEGPELCSYSVAREGKVLAHATYVPLYRYGHGASVYFRSVTDERVLEFVQDFVARLNYTGQIAFDFIDSTQGLLALECNPRATSGIHLLSHDQIANALLAGAQKPEVASPGISRAAKLTLLMTNVVSTKDFFAAQDTAFRLKDPMPFFSQFASALELTYRAWKWKMKAGDAFGYDLEWNGEPFE